VRNVLGHGDADHAETNPEAETLAVTPLTCHVGWGIEGRVTIRPGTLAAELYGRETSDESYYCSYGVNPAFRPDLEAAGLHVSGVDDEEDEPRIVELAEHPFFLATLFIPQVRSRPGAPHPILVGFQQAVARRSAPVPGG
jgi:CTP synthase (UTP-ammonia lyase)